MNTSHTKSRERPFSIYKGARQPPVNERLRQIKNFLCDEDYYRCFRFTEQLEEIDKYVNFLEAREQGYDAAMLRDIKSMIKVHVDWITEEIFPTPLDLNIPNILFVNRLGPERYGSRPGLIQDEFEGAEKLKEKGWPKVEAPLFEVADPKNRPALERDPFHFISLLMDVQKKQDQICSWVRRKLCSQFAKDVLFNPFRIDIPGPIIPLSTEIIRSNRDGWLRRKGELFHSLTQADKVAPRPLLTIVLVNIMDGMSKVRDPLLSSDPPVMNEFDEEVLKQPFLVRDEEILRVLTEPSWNSQAKQLYDVEPPNFSEADRQKLRAFAEDVYLTFATELWPEADSWVSVAGLLNYLNEHSSSKHAPYELDVVKFNLEIMARGNIIRYDSSGVVKKPLLDGHPESRFFWPTLPPYDEVQYNGDKKWGPPLLMDPKEFTILAARLGRSMRVAKECDDIDAEAWIAREKTALAAFEDAINDPPPGAPNIEEYIREAAQAVNLHGDNLERKVDAFTLIQDRLLEELKWNFQSRKPDYAQIWAFAQDKEIPAEPYFALDRWPVSYQTPERQEQIRASGPNREEPPASISTDEEDDEEEGEQERQLQRERSDPRVKYIAGDTVFPFGETPFQQAVMAEQMNLELGDIEELAMTSKLSGRKAVEDSTIDPFALPALPTGWSMGDPTGKRATPTTVNVEEEQQQRKRQRTKGSPAASGRRPSSSENPPPPTYEEALADVEFTPQLVFDAGDGHGGGGALLPTHEVRLPEYSADLGDLERSGPVVPVEEPAPKRTTRRTPKRS